MPAYNKLSGALRTIGVIITGQSNQAGATTTDNGGQESRYRSLTRGTTDPFDLNANGGGSCWGYLIDLGVRRGIFYHIINGAIGGAQAAHFTGLVGATITGSASDPVTFSNMGSSGLSFNAGTPCVEGDAQFDPFTFLARTRARKAQYPQIREWIALFANAESEGATSQAQYQAELVSMSNYHLASGCNAVFEGLSASGGNSQANMDRLEAGRAGAVAQQRALGKPVFDGANMYKKYLMNPALYRERFAVLTAVHYIQEMQRAHAEEWDKAFQAAGF